MHKTLNFADHLRLIDERSTVFRAALAAAPDLDAQVPSCPDWTLFDLAQHMGQSRRRWAATVAAGPADTPPAGFEPGRGPVAPRGREELLAWSAESTELMLEALREAGPDRGCWTWWGKSLSPQTSGAVARHQLLEISVHTYDAQLTLGAPQPLPDAVALDGVEDFLHTCNATTSPWPHEPAVLDYHIAGGRSWRLRFDAQGARPILLPAEGEAPEAADLSARGTADELVMTMYGRAPLESLKLDGDRRVLDRLVEWVPE
ncbi:maleylpyruvate isomerase family mycothiol-dependent enzyme [Streptomyces sp. 1331.2]|uniref:maleylpyruvate isomerase family mycothiol-dependent enzyme n=1 Tax=Streptomyces sp. 1331.2 TaxID=1938835 RepID=UPI000BD820DE|nr:maleylpyruvate isomerase family mycothiol-dependent enzyme [Streptomyces sp. 1331.2]SOB85239.1 TIGR03083 family protein [Streptomyces sp. 1331.2]